MDLEKDQIDIFDYLNSIQKPATSPIDKTAPTDHTETDYLSRGHYIESLAKKKFAAFMDELNITDIEEKIFSVPFGNNICDEVAKKVIRPILRKSDNTKLNEIFNPYGIIFQDNTTTDGGYKYLLYSQHRDSDIVKVTFHDISVYGYRMYTHAKSYRNTLFKDHTRCGDVAIMISYIVLITIYNNYISENTVDWAFLQQTDGQNLFHKLITDSQLNPKLLQSCPDFTGTDFDADEILRHAKKIALPKNVTTCPNDRTVQMVKDLLSQMSGNECSICTMSLIELRKHNERYNTLTDDMDLAIRVTSTDDIYCLMGAAYEPDKKVFAEIRYETLLDTEEGLDRLWGIPSSYHRNSVYQRTMLSHVLQLIWKQKAGIVSQLKYYRTSQQSSHARSFETKKGIPKNIVESMEASSFNKYFYYVELDQDCDAKNVEEIAMEFKTFHDTYFPNLTTDNTSIRFRKLGNHKAAGLFYPSVNCICVDLSYPSSLVHEYGHCIDYNFGNLSNSTEFSKVLDRYSELLKGNAATKELKGKYDLGYYLTPTEVFARSFEMYVTRELKVQNSICKQDDKTMFAYPKDEILMKDIMDFFQSTFKKIA
jgi:hypothetical protein